MSTSLLQVIEAGGYDLTKRDDAKWLLAQQEQFDELIEAAEELIENCPHNDTDIEEIEDTAEYEYNQAIGNTNAGLHTYKVEVCNDCGKQRNLPDGEWE